MLPPSFMVVTRRGRNPCADVRIRYPSSSELLGSSESVREDVEEAENDNEPDELDDDNSVSDCDERDLDEEEESEDDLRA